MSTKVQTVDLNSTVGACLKAMAASNMGCLVVVDKQKAVGIFTERDVVRTLAGGLRNSELRMSKVMSSPLVLVSPMDTIWDAVAAMARKEIRRLPVVADEKLVGIV